MERRRSYAANDRLYIRSMALLDARPLLGTEGDSREPVFSPDGRSVAFYSVAERAIKRVAVSGGAAVTIAAGRRTNRHELGPGRHRLWPGPRRASCECRLVGVLRITGPHQRRSDREQSARAAGWDPRAVHAGERVGPRSVGAGAPDRAVAHFAGTKNAHRRRERRPICPDRPSRVCPQWQVVRGRVRPAAAGTDGRPGADCRRCQTLDGEYVGYRSGSDSRHPHGDKPWRRRSRVQRLRHGHTRIMSPARRLRPGRRSWISS